MNYYNILNENTKEIFIHLMNKLYPYVNKDNFSYRTNSDIDEESSILHIHLGDIGNSSTLLFTIFITNEKIHNVCIFQKNLTYTSDDIKKETETYLKYLNRKNIIDELL